MSKFNKNLKRSRIFCLLFVHFIWAIFMHAFACTHTHTYRVMLLNYYVSELTCYRIELLCYRVVEGHPPPPGGVLKGGRQQPEETLPHSDPARTHQESGDR